MDISMYLRHIKLFSKKKKISNYIHNGFNVYNDNEEGEEKKMLELDIIRNLRPSTDFSSRRNASERTRTYNYNIP